MAIEPYLSIRLPAKGAHPRWSEVHLRKDAAGVMTVTRDSHKRGVLEWASGAWPEPLAVAPASWVVFARREDGEEAWFITVRRAVAWIIGVTVDGLAPGTGRLTGEQAWLVNAWLDAAAAAKAQRRWRPEHLVQAAEWLAHAEDAALSAGVPADTFADPELAATLRQPAGAR